LWTAAIEKKQACETHGYANECYTSEDRFWAMSDELALFIAGWTSIMNSLLLLKN
jgi:hypothetical protein